MSWCPKQSVVVPTDFSDESFAAIDVGIAIGADPRQVHVVHVIAEILTTSPFTAHREMWGEDDKVQQERALDRLRGHLSAPKYQGLDLDVVIGDPGQAIVDFADHSDAELIVMPSHGRTGIDRLLIGSVAERVLRLANCPVLVLRGSSKREGVRDR